LCSHLKIDSTNLIHVDSRKRLLDILKEYEKSLDHDISVIELRDIFKAVGNENSASRLLRVAQLLLDNSSNSNKTPNKVDPQFDILGEEEEVLDSDLDSSSSEDYMEV